VGFTGVSLSANQNSHPLVKIDSPIVTSIWATLGSNQRFLLGLRFRQVQLTEFLSIAVLGDEGTSSATVICACDSISQAA
jgi:hypothetical protein